jgi:hypothetical protein
MIHLDPKCFEDVHISRGSASMTLLSCVGIEGTREGAEPLDFTAKTGVRVMFAPLRAAFSGNGLNTVILAIGTFTSLDSGLPTVPPADRGGDR